VSGTANEGLVVGLTGATGHIGGLLLRRLLDDPMVGQVRSVARRPLAPSLVAAISSGRLAHTTADLREPSARHALQGVDLLYHLAAQVWQGGRTREAVRDMHRANVEGTRNVLLGRPQALVFASSVAVYGAWPDNPLPIGEADEPRPNVECPYALQKLVSEHICAEEVPRRVILRVAAVLGRHADARVARAVRGYRWAVPAIAGAAQAVQWLDEDEAVDGVLAAGRALAAGGDVAGEVVNLAPPDWLTETDVAALARSRVVTLPRRLMVGGAEAGRYLGLSPFGADRAVLISGPLALSAEKAAHLFGWRARTTSAEVLAATMASDWHRLPRNRQP
jgi:UDP-glucose 4-epimerase